MLSRVLALLVETTTTVRLGLGLGLGLIDMSNKRHDL